MSYYLVLVDPSVPPYIRNRMLSFGKYHAIVPSYLYELGIWSESDWFIAMEHIETLHRKLELIQILGRAVNVQPNKAKAKGSKLSS